MISVGYKSAYQQGYSDAMRDFRKKTKTGHWIRVTDKTGHLVWECDKCSWQQRFNTNFCPDCGDKKIDPRESENKE